MLKILLDDTLKYNNGNQGKTYLKVPNQEPEITKEITPEKLLLELAYQENRTITGIEGLILIEEEILENGEARIRQEFVLAPDIAYSLFLHFLRVDKRDFPKKYPGGTTHFD